MVIADWCGLEHAGACVSCEPALPDTGTVQVVVRLTDNPPVVKTQLPGLWPPSVISRETGEAIAAHEPWQLVDAEGRRFVYECQPRD